MPFQKLGLKPKLLSAITTRGYKAATPIQAQSIPSILAGRDVMAGAQTGTGKTAAFALPILQILNDKQRTSRNPRALILTPTRELAAQVVEFIEHYGKGIHLKSTAVFGGVSIRPQISKLRSGVDILVATPGRLLDHINQKTLSLSNIEILVLDEADRMLDMGFIGDIRKVLRLIPKKRQSLLFSATYSKEIKKLADTILNNPELIEVSTRNTTAEKVDQVIHPVSIARKQELLSKLIKEGKWSQVLVFTRTKHGANRVTKQLIISNITAVAIHGNKSQAARTKALADFKGRKVRVLVATDIAARGLDINLLPHVVNFEIPNIAESYIHRIGRTGRAGAEGKAVSLVSQEEYIHLHEIHKLLKYEIPIEKIEGFNFSLNTKEIPQKKKTSPFEGKKSNSTKKFAKHNTGKKRNKKFKNQETSSDRKVSSSENNPHKKANKKPKKLGKKVWRKSKGQGQENSTASKNQQRSKAKK
ncbi:MAG: DEAD/DEAH box helicase [Candidatus Zapsychrus exili]|nr:DEAD/DEAH box helicase [Candidatus Zapsychrus exili]